MTLKNEKFKKVNKFNILKCWIFLKPVIGSVWIGYRGLLKNPYRTNSISSVGIYESQYSVKGFGPFLQGICINI
jgi:hypothetical protein